MWNVYIIRSNKIKWYYVGITNGLQERINEHNNGLVRSTKHYLPFELVFIKDFSTEKEARYYEKFIKDKRIEKEKLIRKIENK